MTAPTTWLLIADGGHARVLQTIGHGNALTPVDGMVFEKDLPPSRELGTDRPPRTHEAAGKASHGLSPRTDLHRQLKQTFAHEIADQIEKAAAAGAFEKLVVVAPPVTLGDLRKLWSKPVADRIVAEVDKDLVKTPNDHVRAHLKDVVAI